MRGCADRVDGSALRSLYVRLQCGPAHPASPAHRARVPTAPRGASFTHPSSIPQLTLSATCTQEFEKREEVGGMPLEAFLLLPIQRIPSYKRALKV